MLVFAQQLAVTLLQARRHGRVRRQDYGDEGLMSWHGGVRGPEQRVCEPHTGTMKTTMWTTKAMAMIWGRACSRAAWRPLSANTTQQHGL